MVGAELTARAQPDGYTIFLADNAFYQNPAILKKLPYDTLKDFSGVTMLAQSPVILVVGGPVQAKDVKSLIQYAKANPGKLTYGSAASALQRISRACCSTARPTSTSFTCRSNHRARRSRACSAIT